MASWCFVTLCIAVFATTSGVLAQTIPDPSYTVLPAATTAAVGHPVTIYCSIANLGRHQVFWNVNQKSDNNPGGKEFTLGPNTNTHTSYLRFKIVGNAENGEFNLQILNVSMADAGIYICLLYDPAGEGSSVMEAHAELTVVDTAEQPQVGYPQCMRDPAGNSRLQTGVYMKGDILTLTCTSEGGVPKPELSWKRVNLDTIVNNLQSTTTVNGDTITATAKVTLTSRDHQSFYKCIETHPARPSSDRSCTTPFSGSESLMDVRYKPEVTITPNVVTVQLLETTKVTLSCTADANPPLSLTPEIILPENKTGIYPRNDKTLVEVEMTTDDVGKDFYCRAGNVLGVGEDSVEVRRLGALPTWLTLVIIGAIAIVLFIFIVIVSCILCVDRSNLEGTKYPRGLRYSGKKSRPTSMRHEGEDGDEFTDDDMAPIGDFDGGHESVAMDESKPTVNSDFETGETGPRYQNLNAAFQQDTAVVEPDSSPTEVFIEPGPI